MNKEQFLEKHPAPVKNKKGFKCQKDPDKFNQALELIKSGYSVKLIAQEFGFGYDSLLRATRKERIVK